MELLPAFNFNSFLSEELKTESDLTLYINTLTQQLHKTLKINNLIFISDFKKNEVYQTVICSFELSNLVVDMNDVSSEKLHNVPILKALIQNEKSGVREFCRDDIKASTIILPIITNEQHWLGVTITNTNHTLLGALLISKTKEEKALTHDEKLLIEHITFMLSLNVSTLKANLELKERNHAITSLENKIQHYKDSEKLQHALYKISSIHSKETDLSDFYSQIHQIISNLIYAENFFIALYDDDEQSVTFPYFIDEYENDVKDKTLPLGDGMTSYLIKTRAPKLLNQSLVKELVEQGYIKEILGADSFTSWIGAPLIANGILYGAIVIQSYLPDKIYKSSDLNLLSFVAEHIAQAIDTELNMRQRQESQIKLSEQHRLLEEKNKDLEQVVNKLKLTQKELIQKEKMASLGGLVAGIAHEINTPLGICVTAVSHLEEEYKLIKKLIADNELNETDLFHFFDDLEEVITILNTNTSRGAQLVNSFKQVAVDQSSNDLRIINVSQYIQEVILSLRPKLKRTNVDISVVCDEALSIQVTAGAISQILSNLILNSIKHGFTDSSSGRILIECYKKGANIILKYADDGIGVESEALAKLFEPFYTTKRGDGGSGLGTHLIYNIVSSVLKGKITVQSQLNKGLAYLIKFPANLG